MKHSHLLTVPAIVLASLASAHAETDVPRLLSVVEQPPAAAVRWALAEQSTNPQIARSALVRVHAGVLRDVLANLSSGPQTVSLEILGERVLIDFRSSQRQWQYDVLEGHPRATDGDVRIAVHADHDVTAGEIRIGRHMYSLTCPDETTLTSVLHELDGSRIAPPHRRCGTGTQHAIAVPGKRRAGTYDPTSGRGGDSAWATHVADVMVFYTTQARRAAGGRNAIESELATRVSGASRSLPNVGLDFNLRLVYTGAVRYAETGANIDLDRFRQNGDGHMDGVHALRTSYGGDLMALIIETSSNWCGLGYLMTSPGTGFQSSAFSVTVRSCLSGKVLSHELGHNMGCHHDRGNAGGSGSYSYSFGARTPDNQYRTIMAYSPGVVVNKWSGPNVTHNGMSLGDSRNDNTRTLDNNKSIISSFRKRTTPLWTCLGGGVRGGNGRPSIHGQGTIDGTVPIQVTVGGMVPGAPGVFIMALSDLNLPIWGGTLVPSIDIPVTITGSSTPFVLPATSFALLPDGFELWFQALFLDNAAVQGVSMTDGLKVRRPNR